ncbi:hypothetical protein N185_37005 [Sinorhizobium sp. GW3]|jgi:hypothetical protein|nr:hypothetical protein N185_37005 [Sinorhizobium sp. GW3]KSV64821.1 hypothetical protein N182_36230 [Sinorhizobium sp. GL2]
MFGIAFANRAAVCNAGSISHSSFAGKAVKGKSALRPRQS